MGDYEKCCSIDGHGLSYEGFSVVFIQTFSIHHNLEFFVPADYIPAKNNGEQKASKTDKPMLYMEQNIEHQIFLGQKGRRELVRMYMVPDNSRSGITDSPGHLVNTPGSSNKDSAKNVILFPQDGVYRFSMRGFDFELPVPSEDDGPDEVLLSGHVNVEMSLFYGHTVSITYRFLFDGQTAKVTRITDDPDENKITEATTDHIIALLSTYLGAEYWSRDKDSKDTSGEALSQTDINLMTKLKIKGFWCDEEGNLLNSPDAELNCYGKGRTFDAVCERYKKFIYNHCTAFKIGLDRAEIRKYLAARKPLTVENDLHYGFVDIWENVHHYNKKGKDLFKQKIRGGLTSAQVIDHIRDWHKPELIGLMTMYPGEWPFRCASDYDDICGRNIAIDTDDLVLAGTNMAVVFGTYGRRGGDVSVKTEGEVGTGVNWSDHLKERRRYHVSWPEYLLILQMVLAKKYRINLAKDQLVNVTLRATNESSEELIGKNAELSMRLSRMILQLDVVKYSKFPSHVVMFERTTERLGLDKDMEQLRNVMDMVDNSLSNLSDYKAMKADFFLNMILAIISVASTFELLFQNAEFPFLTYFDIKSGGLAAWLVTVTASLTVFALLLVLKNAVQKTWNLFIRK